MRKLMFHHYSSSFSFVLKQLVLPQTIKPPQSRLREKCAMLTQKKKHRQTILPLHWSSACFFDTSVVQHCSGWKQVSFLWNFQQSGVFLKKLICICLTFWVIKMKLFVSGATNTRTFGQLCSCSAIADKQLGHPYARQTIPERDRLTQIIICDKAPNMVRPAFALSHFLLLRKSHVEKDWVGKRQGPYSVTMYAWCVAVDGRATTTSKKF